MDLYDFNRIIMQLIQFNVNGSNDDEIAFYWEKRNKLLKKIDDKFKKLVTKK
jgi:hypothetical protein